MPSQTPTNSSPAPTDASTVATDPWTPSQESALFKAIIRAKPAGMHKHMHMLTISQAVRDSYNVSRHTPEEHGLPAHLHNQGIWQKLQQLYDLPALDEREESYRLSGPRFRRGRDGVAREVESGEDSDGQGIQDGKWEEFSLIGPRDPPAGSEDVAMVGEKWDGPLQKLSRGSGHEAEFAERMWERRLPGDGKTSEEEEQADEDEAGEQEQDDDDGDETEAKEAPVRSKPRTKGSTRLSTRRTGGGRRGSKASVIAESEDAADDEEHDGSTASSPPGKSTRRATRSARKR